MSSFFAWIFIWFYSISEGIGTTVYYTPSIGRGWAVVLGLVSGYGFYLLMSWAFDNRYEQTTRYEDR